MYYSVTAFFSVKVFPSLGGKGREGMVQKHKGGGEGNLLEMKKDFWD